MSEEYKIQVNTTINGNLVNLRAQSGEDLANLVKGFAENTEAFLDALGQVKQAFVAKDVFTGDTNKKSAPADSQQPSSGGGVPRCKHGEMKDLRHMKYKSDFYCPEKNRDQQCKPVKA